MIKRKYRRLIKRLVDCGDTTMYILTAIFNRGYNGNFTVIEKYINKCRKGGGNK